MNRRTFRISLVVAALALLSGAVALTFGCSSARTVDLVWGGRSALEATRDAVAGEGEPAVEPALSAAIDRFLGLFEDFVPDAVERAVRELYAEDAYFNDGFVECFGVEQIAAYLRRSAEASEQLAVDVEDVTRHGGEVYVRWVMTFTARSVTVVAPGISHLRINTDGRILYHRDYWDASGALAQFVPLVPSVLKAIRNRL